MVPPRKPHSCRQMNTSATLALATRGSSLYDDAVSSATEAPPCSRDPYIAGLPVCREVRLLRSPGAPGIDTSALEVVGGDPVSAKGIGFRSSQLATSGGKFLSLGQQHTHRPHQRWHRSTGKSKGQVGGLGATIINIAPGGRSDFSQPVDASIAFRAITHGERWLTGRRTPANHKVERDKPLMG